MRWERDGGTRMAYASISTWAFFLYFVGPFTPLVATQLGLTPQVAGLIGLALAAGLIAVGLVGARYVRRWGRRAGGVAAALLLAAASALLVVSPGFPVVLVGVFAGACAGAMLMNVGTASLVDRHGPAGPRALTEANAAAAWIGLLSPLLLGIAAAAGPGWRAVAAIIGVVALALAFALRRVPLTEPAPTARAGVVDVADVSIEAPLEPSAAPGPLPRSFTVALVAIVAAVGTEISLNFWGAVLLAQTTGADLAVTTALLSVLIGGIAVGRTLGATLTRRFAVPPLVYASLALAAAGFLVVWTAPWLGVAVIGLFVTGLGFALLFPLTSSLALGHAGGHTDRAMAVIALVIGATMGVAPFLLGVVAGAVSVTAGFAVVPLLLVIGAAAVRQVSRTEPADSATRHAV